MSKYYNPHRTRNLYDPKSTEPFRISRSKIDLFIKCPRCFYLDRRLGVGQPPGYPFSLNSAVDTLLKKEFDMHRAEGTAHPLMEAYGLDAVPLEDDRMDEWRDSLRRGVTVAFPGTNLVLTGGVDDVWVKPDGELLIVDYKAAFDGKLEFSIKLIPYTGDDGWIEGVVGALYKCLQGGEIPASGKECDFCAYREAVKGVC